MPFTNTASIGEASKRLEPLQFHLQDIYSKLGYQPYDDLKGNEAIPDVRASTLLICKSDITNNILILNFLSSMIEAGDAEPRYVPASTWRSITGVKDEAIPLWWVADRLSLYLRLSFVTMFQFRVENMIVNILNTLDKTKVIRQYLKNAENLLTLISRNNKTELLETLKILQHIRNSLHSNGVHNNANMTITIDDCMFEFKRGQFVNCAGWAHIAIAIKTTTDTLYEILNTPEIRALRAPIIDHYIEQE